MTTEHLNPNDLIFIQSRAESDPALVEEYAGMMEDGVGFDPAQAVSDGKYIYVWDGYHRGEAAKRTGKAIFVMVKPGTREEAEWLALSANQRHGLRRSNADKRRIVELALSHPRGAQMSDNSIAHHCGVSQPFVGKIRAELAASYNGYKMADKASGNDYQIEPRTVTRGGQTYEMNTASIGTRPTLPQSPYGETQTGDPYAVTECPNCDQKKVFILPSLNRAGCDGCGRVWETILSYHAERRAKLEKEKVLGQPDVAAAGIDGPNKRPGSVLCPYCDDAIFIEQDTRPNGNIVCDYCKHRFANYDALMKAAKNMEEVKKQAYNPTSPKGPVPISTERQLAALEKAAGGPDEARQALEVQERERILAECAQYFNQIVDTANLSDLEVMRAWLEDFYMDGL